VGFEPTISASERAKRVHALNLATIVTSCRSQWGSTIVMDLQGVMYESVDRILFIHARVQWRTFLNSVIHFRFPYNKRGISLPGEGILVLKKKHCPLELITSILIVVQVS
jgi:hypothetical protein